MQEKRFHQPNGWGVIEFHCSLNTEDDLITYLVVELCMGQFMYGASSQSEQWVRYIQVLRIKGEKVSNAKFTVKSFRNTLTK